MTRPRVLVVEDDASLRRWVEMVLEREPIELVVCADGSAALSELARGSFRLLVTDLMMPGVSGRELLRRLHAQPGLGGMPLRAVFSAGLDAGARRSLSGLGVWRWLHKPTPMADLLACIRDAVAAPQPPTPAAREDSMGRHFGGDEALFRTYRASCFEQFGHDAAAGDVALAAHDAAALRRLGHSLKTVLLTLGEADAEVAARALEAAAAAGDWAVLQRQWPGFAAWLRARATGMG